MTTQDDFSEETIEKHDIECLMDLPGCTANQKDPKVSQPGSVSTSPRSSINEEKGSTDESAAEIDLRFRRKFSRVSKLRAMKKGDLVAVHDHTLQESHKCTLFAVDIAPYVLPPIDASHIETGGDMRVEKDKQFLSRERKRVRRLKEALKKQSHQHLDHYEDKYIEQIEEDQKYYLEKGKKQREMLSKNFQYLVATTGNRYICVYVTTNAPTGKMLLKQVYEDKDGDEFYCVKFTTLRSIGKDGQVNEHRVLVCAGLRGVIRMIDVWRGKNIDSISPAATNSINDMALHPAFPEIVACASKDLSIHVWNLATSVQVFTLCSRGLYGHVDEVLTCDWSPDGGNKLISSGMDHYLVLWDLSTEKCKNAINLSYKYNNERDENGDHIYKPTLPMWIFFPKLVNKTVHKNYVDCAKFLSPQIVVSKSSENYLAAWIPDESRDDNTVKSSCITLFQYGLINCKIWFMKFALSPSTRRLLALGLQDGRVMILDLKADEDPTDLRVCFIKANNTAPVGAIRQVAFSLDSKLLVGVTQDGKVVKWSLSGSTIPASSFGPVPQVLKNISAEQEEENEEEEEVKEQKNEGTENDEIQKLSEVDTAMQDITDLAAQVEEKLDCGLENPVDLPEMSA